MFLVDKGCSEMLLQDMFDAGDITSLTTTSESASKTINDIFMDTPGYGLQFQGADPDKTVTVRIYKIDLIDL